MDSTYGNLLKQYLQTPGSYTGSPGFTFARDQGLQAAQRQAQAQGMGNSGNVLAELTKLGTGYASQDYGSTIDRLGKLSGQEQSYDLGQGQNANTAESNRLTGIRDTNQYSLGQAQNANTATRNANDFTLGQGQNANTAQRNANDFGLGTYQATNQYNLGHEANTNTAQNNWWNYDLGTNRNNVDAANNQNNFNLGQGRNAIDWYNAGTSRGNAQSNAYLGDQRNQRDWYSIYPRQRTAGQP